MSLPPGWASASDANGNIYYYNGSGAVQWTHPGPPAEANVPLAFAEGASKSAPPLAFSPPTALDWAAPPQQRQAWAPGAPQSNAPTTVVIINNNALASSRSASGFIEACGCCGSCEWVQVTVDEERVETLREQRGLCVCCDPAAQMESVEWAHIESIRGEEGWVPNFKVMAFGLLLFTTAIGLFIIANNVAAEVDLGIAFLVFSFGLFGLGCCREARLSYDSFGDARPFETDGIAASSLPYGSFDTLWQNVRFGWLAHRGPLKEAITVVGASTPVPIGTASTRAASGTYPLGLSSSLSLSPEGLVEVKERCCLVKRRSLTWGDKVKWVRMPSQCVCAMCSKLQMGTAHDEYIEAPMDGLHSAALTRVLKASMLARPSARVDGSASTFTACAPQWSCTCPRTTITIDNDFTAIDSQSTCVCPGSTVLLRSEDVPFIYSERSAKLWCQGICSILLTLAVILTASFVINTVGADPLILFVVAGAAPLLLLCLCSLGCISSSSIASLCFRFTVVTLGTPGSAVVDEDAGASAQPSILCWLCCFWLALLCFLRGRLCAGKTGKSKVYSCEDAGGSASRSFVAAAKTHIMTANHTARRAKEAGLIGAAKA